MTVNLSFQQPDAGFVINVNIFFRVRPRLLMLIYEVMDYLTYMSIRRKMITEKMNVFLSSTFLGL